MQPLARKPVVAGQFYPASEKDLLKELAPLFDLNVKRKDVCGCILPHAGYAYSAAVAAKTLSRINLKKIIILLGPNHTGFGRAYSIMTEGSWLTPLGSVPVETELAQSFLKVSKYLQNDYAAHQHEHSLEVELPLLQFLDPHFSIVPIAFMSDNASVLKEIGKELAEVIKNKHLETSVLIVASSDMTHYEPQAIAREKDAAAIEAIARLDEDALQSAVTQRHISMCGVAPVTVMLSLAKALGSQKGELIAYQTSGDVTGETDSVVGYAGILIS